MTLENTSERNVLTNYGTRPTDTQYGGTLAGEAGKLRVVEYAFTYDELPGHTGADVDINDTNLAVTIPAGARITGSTFDVLDGFTSTGAATDLVVGLYQADGGGVLDADGLFDATDLDVLIIDNETRVVSAGALLNAVVLAEEMAVVVAPDVDDLITGRALLTISYFMVPGPQGHQNQDGTYDGTAVP